MKKTVILVIVSLLMTAVLFAEEPLAFKVTAASDAYKQIYKGYGEYDTTVITIKKGDIVYSNKKARMDYIEATRNLNFMMFLTGQNEGYEIYVKNLIPVNTENVFGKDIFIDYPPVLDDAKEMWVPAYYGYVLKSEYRETFLEFNPTLEMLFAPETWYQEDHISNIKNGRSMFYNAAITIGYNTHFLVKNIKKTEYGYAVNCFESISDFEENSARVSYQLFQDTKFWDEYNLGDEITLHLYIDGDCMDIYAGSKDFHLGTLIKVKKEFIEEYQKLIRNNKCDLSRITAWPKRADGSLVEYLPPAKTADIYQEEDEIPEAAIEQKAITQADSEKFSLPLWAWLAVIGGTVVIVFAIALASRRK